MFPPAAIAVQLAKYVTATAGTLYGVQAALAVMAMVPLVVGRFLNLCGGLGIEIIQLAKDATTVASPRHAPPAPVIPPWRR